MLTFLENNLVKEPVLIDVTSITHCHGLNSVLLKLLCPLRSSEYDFICKQGFDHVIKLRYGHNELE